MPVRHERWRWGSDERLGTTGRPEPGRNSDDAAEPQLSRAPAGAARIRRGARAPFGVHDGPGSGRPDGARSPARSFRVSSGGSGRSSGRCERSGTSASPAPGARITPQRSSRRSDHSPSEDPFVSISEPAGAVDPRTGLGTHRVPALASDRGAFIPDPDPVPSGSACRRSGRPSVIVGTRDARGPQRGRSRPASTLREGWPRDPRDLRDDREMRDFCVWPCTPERAADPSKEARRCQRAAANRRKSRSAIALRKRRRPRVPRAARASRRSAAPRRTQGTMNICERSSSSFALALSKAASGIVWIHRTRKSCLSSFEGMSRLSNRTQMRSFSFSGVP